MSKFRFSNMVILTSMVTSISYAQTFSVQAPAQKVDKGILSAVPAPPKPMSASDFKSEVSTKNQQTQSDISKQVTQILSKQPANPVPPLPTENQQKKAAKEAIDAGGTPTENKPSTAPVKESAPAEVPPAPEPVAAPQEVQPPAAESSPQQAPSSTVHPQPSQPYTGFGGGSSNGSSKTNENTNSGSQQSGGWNIKY